MLSYLLSANTTLGTREIVISLCCALIFAMFMYGMYRLTYKGVVYSKSFNLTLMLIAVVTTVIMLVIGNNLALSLGMVGSLSIIRFRTAIKEPRDIAFLFWAICIGLTCGAQMYEIVFWGSLVIAAVLLVFGKDICGTNAYLVVARGKDGMPAALQNGLKGVVKRQKVRMQNVLREEVEVTMEISIRDKDLIRLQEQLKQIPEIESYNIVAYSGEMVG